MNINESYIMKQPTNNLIILKTMLESRLEEQKNNKHLYKTESDFIDSLDLTIKTIKFIEERMKM